MASKRKNTEERKRLLAEYTKERRRILRRENEYRKQGGIINKEFAPKETANQIKNINIRSLRKKVSELKDISYLTIRKETEFKTPYLHTTITASQEFTRRRIIASKKSRKPRQSIPIEHHSATNDNTKNQMQNKEEIKYGIISEYLKVLSYIDRYGEGELINNKDDLKEIAQRFKRFFNENIEDQEEVKNYIIVSNIEEEKTTKNPKGGASPVDEDYWDNYQDKDTVKFEPETPSEPIRDSDEYADDNESEYYDIVENITELLEESFYLAGEGFVYRSHHRGKSAGYRPYDTTKDKNTALGVWKATINRYSHTKHDRDFLIEYCIENETRIGELLNDIQYAKYEDEYIGYFTELLNKLNVTAFSLTELQQTYDGYAY